MVCWPLNAEPTPDRLTALFAALLTEYHAADVVRQVAGGAGAAAWLSPAAAARFAELEQDTRPAIHRLTSDGGARYDRFWDWVVEHLPDEPVWFLDVIGVDPAAQGSGLGVALIQDGLARARADGVPAVLEDRHRGEPRLLPAVRVRGRGRAGRAGRRPDGLVPAPRAPGRRMTAADLPMAVHQRRWPATATVLAVIGLQLALPVEMGGLPRLLLPGVELALLVPVVVSNPVRLVRDSAWVRRSGVALSIVVAAANALTLVVLVRHIVAADTFGRMSPGSMVRAGLLIWTTNVAAAAVAFWGARPGGPVRPGPGPPPHPGAARPAVPAADRDPGLGRRGLAPGVRRLPVRGLHRRDRVQPDRHPAAVLPGEADHHAGLGGLAGDGRHPGRPRGERDLTRRSP